MFFGWQHTNYQKKKKIANFFFWVKRAAVMVKTAALCIRRAATERVVGQKRSP